MYIVRSFAICINLVTLSCREHSLPGFKTTHRVEFEQRRGDLLRGVNAREFYTTFILLLTFN